MNVHFKEVVPGTGQIDYATYLSELSKLDVDAPLMLEHLQTPEEYRVRPRLHQVGRPARQDPIFLKGAAGRWFVG